MAWNNDDYIGVNERIAAFLAKFPDGSLQSEIVEHTESRVTVKAYAYRYPDDPRPGVGHSALGIPGKTNFTRDSEVENAETSAWGRAIASLGFEVKRSLASAEEVRSKQSDAPVRTRDEGGQRKEKTPADLLQWAWREHRMNKNDVFKALGVESVEAIAAMGLSEATNKLGEHLTEKEPVNA